MSCEEVDNYSKRGADPDHKPAIFTSAKKLKSISGDYTIFVRDHNLWVSDCAAATEYALTKNGTKLNSYGESPSFWVDNSLQAVWSPDSRKILTVQLNRQGVSMRPYVEYVPFDGSLYPKVSHQRRAYPGDKDIGSWTLLVVDVSTGKEQPINYSPLPVTSPYGTFFSDKRGWWSADSQAI